MWIFTRHGFFNAVCVHQGDGKHGQRRGWAIVRGDELHGMIFFHGGEDSEFVATKAESWKKLKK